MHKIDSTKTVKQIKTFMLVFRKTVKFYSILAFYYIICYYTLYIYIICYFRNKTYTFDKRMVHERSAVIVL